MYETEDSSVASSYGDQDDMEHFLNRCSICFDAPLDMCLEYCRDQYCIDCFQRFVFHCCHYIYIYNIDIVMIMIDT
jgi:hypothetical protein